MAKRAIVGPHGGRPGKRGIQVYVPVELHALATAWATSQHRSLHQQMMMWLEEGLARDRRIKPRQMRLAEEAAAEAIVHAREADLLAS